MVFRKTQNSENVFAGHQNVNLSRAQGKYVTGFMEFHRCSTASIPRQMNNMNYCYSKATQNAAKYFKNVFWPMIVPSYSAKTIDKSHAHLLHPAYMLRKQQ
jgi:hypothetical protein